MGLFSGGFGTGLATGLAESVDQSLKNAMDKREKELSRARQFWETRQAQKMDLADAHDERAGAALDKLINEFNGDVAKGLAAYQAVGGNVDDVENYLAQVQDTRNKLGSYNIADKLKLDGIDMSQFGDLSRDKAFQSIRKDVSGIDVQMQDTGLLGKIGFGRDLGADISASVNELMPARQYEDITEFAAATMDRSGLVGTEEYARQIASETLRGQERYFYNIGQIQSGELSVEEKEKLQDENAAILLATELFEKAKDTTGGDFTTLTELTAQYKNWRTSIEDGIGYVAGKPGQAAIAYDGDNQLTGQAAVDFRNKTIAAEQPDWIRSNLLDDKGQARSVDAQAMITGHDFRSIVKGIQNDIASAAEAEGDVETPTVEGSIVDPNYDPESEDNEAAQAAAAEDNAEVVMAQNLQNTDWVLSNPQATVDEMFNIEIAKGTDPQTIINQLFNNYQKMGAASGQYQEGSPELQALYDILQAKLKELEENQPVSFEDFGKPGAGDNTSESISESRRSARHGG
jgi:hypothetical protein